MICTPEFIAEMGKKARSGDVRGAENVCNCFRPEIQKVARQVNYRDREQIIEEIRDYFIYIIMNFDPAKMG